MNVFITYPQGKTKALTLSYDDGSSQDERLLQIFNKYGIKATFNLCSGWLQRDYPEKEALADKIAMYEGHEISTHTFTHPTMERLPLNNVAGEILEDRKFLESLTQTPVRGHAYPNGSYSAEIKTLLKGLGIAYARVVPNEDGMNLPKDFYEWHPTCHHGDADLMEKAKFFAEFNKRQYLKLMYVWGHSYEFDRDNNWNVIEEFCTYMGGREDIWYCTNIAFADYMRAAKRLQFSADSSFVYNPNAETIWLQTQDGRIIEAKSGCVTYL